MQQEHRYALHLLFLQFILQHSLLFLQILPFALQKLDRLNSDVDGTVTADRLNSDVDGTATADWPGANKPKPPPLFKLPPLLKLLLRLMFEFEFEFMPLKKETKSNGLELVGAVFVWKLPNDN